MSRNTNPLFWVVCGAIVILTIFAMINNRFNIIENVFSRNNNTVSTADNNATPEKPTYIGYKIENNTYYVTFKTSKNSTRYRCAYGPRSSAVKNSAIASPTSSEVVCSFPVKDNKDVYVQVFGQNTSKETGSDIIKVQYTE